MSKRGFAAMPPERQREIARMGGKALPNDKRSFSTNPELASRAGKLGGAASQRRHKNAAGKRTGD